MASVEELTERLRAALQREPLALSIKIDFGTDGVIRAEGYTVTNDDDDAACTLAISKADMDAVLAGQLDPVTAARSGKLQVIGDPAAAVGAQAALVAAWMQRPA